MQPASRRRRAYAAVMLSTVITTLDSSIANIALPTIGRELHAAPAVTVWVVTAFQLALTASLFAFGALGESLGVTRVWRFGFTAFGIASVGCALSHSMPMLILSRVLQGIGAAANGALSAALIRDIYPRSRMGHAFGLNAMYTSVAAAAAPTLGGMLLAVLPWQWLFAINIPIVFVVWFLAHDTVPDVPGIYRRLDVPSIVTSALGFATVIYALNGFARGDAHLVIALELLIGFAAFAWFVRRQFTLAEPLIALDLFRLPRFSVGSQASFCAWSAWGVGIVTLPFFLQLDFGLTPLQSGLLMTAWPLSNALVAVFAGAFADRSGIGWLATGGLCTLAFSLLLYLYTAFHPNFVLVVLAGIIGGAGFGLFQTPNNREILSSGPPEKGGSVAAIFAAMRVGGQTTGASLVAIAFATFAPAATAHVAPAAIHTAVTAAFGIGILVALVGVLVSGQRAVGGSFTGAARRGLEEDVTPIDAGG